jgi:hypothetical protein
MLVPIQFAGATLVLLSLLAPPPLLAFPGAPLDSSLDTRAFLAEPGRSPATPLLDSLLFTPLELLASSDIHAVG